ncbi:hypothetical protein R1flu_009804 [Riccia fluitans]|uniref:Secreted protein n=1 Tax=Riccia fluitans TaxID=41844 RepID=A0ABD1Z658_9MARC
MLRLGWLLSLRPTFFGSNLNGMPRRRKRQEQYCAGRQIYIGMWRKLDRLLIPRTEASFVGRQSNLLVRARPCSRLSTSSRNHNKHTSSYSGEAL